jgi:plasmid stabilization system protein ParE
VSYVIKSSRLADADVDNTVARIEQHISLVSAARWHAGLRAAVRRLATNPERYPLAYEAVDLGIELREMLYGRHRHVYRILFTIDGQTVNIHRIRHAAQDRLSSDDI